MQGYSVRGRRGHGQHDGHARGRTNVIGALLDRPLINVGLFQGNINSDVFHAWLTQQLLPGAPAGAVIVMDHAAFHKRCDVRQTIIRSGRLRETLSTYSPDLNPIEPAWAQAKARRRQVSLYCRYPFGQRIASSARSHCATVP
jgi:transposase